jgi:hypothetical protein
MPRQFPLYVTIGLAGIVLGRLSLRAHASQSLVDVNLSWWTYLRACPNDIMCFPSQSGQPRHSDL